MATSLLDAFKAHPGHVGLPDGGHGGYCLICGERATLDEQGRIACAGGCEPTKAAKALVEWYEQVWLPEHQSPNGKPRAAAWPPLPRPDADRETVRGYLTGALALPAAYRVDRAVRFGPTTSDPVSIWLRREGQHKDTEVRFDELLDLTKPAKLRTTVAAATAGASVMRNPTIVQACDFVAAVCRLAELLDRSTVADETRDWLDEFLGHCRRIPDRSLADPEQRLDALTTLRGVPEFDRVQAGAYLRRELPRESWPALVIDSVSGERWIRAGEFQAYMRHVYGTTVRASTLNARLREIGAERLPCEVNRPGLAHIRLVMYRLPPEQID